MPLSDLPPSRTEVSSAVENHIYQSGSQEITLQRGEIRHLFRSAPGTIKHDIILPNPDVLPETGSDWEDKWNLELAPGLSISPSSAPLADLFHSDFLLHDPLGNLVGRIPAPEVVDANGKFAPRESSGWRWNPGSNGFAITLVVKQDWLTDAAFPVTVDPGFRMGTSGYYSDGCLGWGAACYSGYRTRTCELFYVWDENRTYANWGTKSIDCLDNITSAYVDGIVSAVPNAGDISMYYPGYWYIKSCPNWSDFIRNHQDKDFASIFASTQRWYLNSWGENQLEYEIKNNKERMLTFVQDNSGSAVSVEWSTFYLNYTYTEASCSNDADIFPDSWGISIPRAGGASKSFSFSPPTTVCNYTGCAGVSWTINTNGSQATKPSGSNWSDLGYSFSPSSSSCSTTLYLNPDCYAPEGTYRFQVQAFYGCDGNSLPVLTTGYMDIYIGPSNCSVSQGSGGGGGRYVNAGSTLSGLCSSLNVAGNCSGDLDGSWSLIKIQEPTGVTISWDPSQPPSNAQSGCAKISATACASINDYWEFEIRWNGDCNGNNSGPFTWNYSGRVGNPNGSCTISPTSGTFSFQPAECNSGSKQLSFSLGNFLCSSELTSGSWSFQSGASWDSRISASTSPPSGPSTTLTVSVPPNVPPGTYSGTLSWSGTCNGSSYNPSVPITVIVDSCPCQASINGSDPIQVTTGSFSTNLFNVNSGGSALGSGTWLLESVPTSWTQQGVAVQIVQQDPASCSVKVDVPLGVCSLSGSARLRWNGECNYESTAITKDFGCVVLPGSCSGNFPGSQVLGITAGNPNPVGTTFCVVPNGSALQGSWSVRQVGPNWGGGPVPSWSPINPTTYCIGVEVSAGISVPEATYRLEFEYSGVCNCDPISHTTYLDIVVVQCQLSVSVPSTSVVAGGSTSTTATLSTGSTQNYNLSHWEIVGWNGDPYFATVSLDQQGSTSCNLSFSTTGQTPPTSGGACGALSQPFTGGLNWVGDCEGIPVTISGQFVLSVDPLACSATISGPPELFASTSQAGTGIFELTGGSSVSGGTWQILDLQGVGHTYDLWSLATTSWAQGNPGILTVQVVSPLPLSPLAFTGKIKNEGFCCNFQTGGPVEFPVTISLTDCPAVVTRNFPGDPSWMPLFRPWSPPLDVEFQLDNASGGAWSFSQDLKFKGNPSGSLLPGTLNVRSSVPTGEGTGVLTWSSQDCGGGPASLDTPIPYFSFSADSFGHRLGWPDADGDHRLSVRDLARIAKEVATDSGDLDFDLDSDGDLDETDYDLARRALLRRPLLSRVHGPNPQIAVGEEFSIVGFGLVAVHPDGTVILPTVLLDGVEVPTGSISATYHGWSDLPSSWTWAAAGEVRATCLVVECPAGTSPQPGISVLLQNPYGLNSDSFLSNTLQYRSSR